MQKILNEKQFEKWTALKEEHQGIAKEIIKETGKEDILKNNKEEVKKNG